MVLEVERKFLIDSQIINEILEKDKFLKSKIIQFYTKISKNEEIRYRKFGKIYTKTTKIGSGLARRERELEIGKDEFKKALKFALTEPIFKTRFSFKINNLPCFIDFFKEKLEGLCFLEIEFLKIDEANSFEIPKFLQNYIIKEITNDERYKNKNLALNGASYDFDYQKTIKILNKNALKDDLKLFFPGGIDSFDALRLVFFKLCKSINKNKLNFLENKKVEFLENLELNLKKTEAFLEIFDKNFDETLTQNLKTKFQNIIKTINYGKEFDSFFEFIDAKDLKDEKINNLINKHKESSIKMNLELASPSVQNFLKEWEVVLCESSDFYKGSAVNLTFKTLLSYKMRVQILKTLKEMKSLNQNLKNINFKNSLKEIEKLYFLISDFYDIYDFKEIEKSLEKIKLMRELFLSLQKVIFWLEFNQNSTKLQQQIETLREKILKNRKKFIKNLHKLSKKLKIYY